MSRALSAASPCDTPYIALGATPQEALLAAVATRPVTKRDIDRELVRAGFPIWGTRYTPNADVLKKLADVADYSAPTPWFSRRETKELADYIRPRFKRLFSERGSTRPLLARYFLLHEGADLKLSTAEMKGFARHLFAENGALFPREGVHSSPRDRLRAFLELDRFLERHMATPGEKHDVIGALARWFPAELLWHAQSRGLTDARGRAAIAEALAARDNPHSAFLSFVAGEVSAGVPVTELASFVGGMTRIAWPARDAEVSQWIPLLAKPENRALVGPVLERLVAIAAGDPARARALLPIAEALMPKGHVLDGLALVAPLLESPARHALVAQHFFAEIERQWDLGGAWAATAAHLTPGQRRGFEMAIAQEAFRRGEALSPKFRRDLRETSPHFRAIEYVHDLENGRHAGGARYDVAEVEAHLRARLDHIVESGAPPPGGWAPFLRMLPQAERAPFVARILKRDIGSATKLAEFIAQLEPGDGVREAVAEVLSSVPLIARNDIGGFFRMSHVQLMFGGERFQSFFPQMRGTLKNDGYDLNRLAMALGTSPTGKVNMSWVHSQEGVSARVRAAFDSLGFVVAARNDNFRFGLPVNRWRDGNHPDIIRGFVIQGIRGRAGQSFLVGQATRGGGQIERDGPMFVEVLQDLLAGDVKDPLERRLLVEGWNVSNDGTLINTIRNDALRAASADGTFYDLRVEIHNFPTRDVVKRTKEFAKKYEAGSENAIRLDKLITDLEKFLGDGDRSADLRETVGSFRVAADFTPYLDAPPEKELGTLLALRAYHARLPSLDGKIGPVMHVAEANKLSSFALAAGERALGRLAAPVDARDAAALAGDLVAHSVADGLLPAGFVEPFKAELTHALADSSLTAPARKALVSRLLQNAVEQAYFRLEREYGALDATIAHFGNAPAEVPKFVDGVLRSHSIYVLQRLVDKMEGELTAEKNLAHDVNGTVLRHPMEALNPGDRVGVLRLNKDPMTLSRDEIGVFEKMPAETAALGGIITVGVGARLSHLQLLAKSLGIPNAKVSPQFLPELKKLDGKRVRFTVLPHGELKITEVAPGAGVVRQVADVTVPVPDHAVTEPLSFDAAKDWAGKNIAGPKGLQLVRLRRDAKMRKHVPDGFILPFGFFDRYAKEAGISDLLATLSRTPLDNRATTTLLLGTIRERIETHPVPEHLLDEVMAELRALEARSGGKGFFFRSDTNIEDLPNFNGAGLNHSVANVPADRAKVAAAIKRVWASPFTEKSVYWRGEALGKPNVTIAEPSIVVMPTVPAASSGVILSRGGLKWEAGKGTISANWGIGSTVEANTPVEEISLEAGVPHRSAFTVTNQKPVAGAEGLALEPVTPGTPVLSDAQVKELNRLATDVERTLGAQPHGWDIEWAIDDKGKVVILQARPNM